jgi:hypothetical protein
VEIVPFDEFGTAERQNVRVYTTPFELGLQVVRPLLCLAQRGSGLRAMQGPVLSDLEAQQEQPLVEESPGLLELSGSREPHRLHDIQDEAEERSPVLLTVLCRGHSVEEAFPLRVLVVEWRLWCFQRSDQVRDLGTQDRISEDATDLLDR